MAQKIIVENREWAKEENRLNYCRELEAGNILFFSDIPFPFPQDQIDFLLQQKQGKSKGRKNIAYKPELDRITNHDASDGAVAKRLHEVLRNYSKSAVEFLSLLLAPYAKEWRLDYASFRPFQEKGRKLRVRARNDLLHVDSFPTRPMHGSRILRFFTNINPTEGRKWITSDPFGELAKKYGGIQGVPFPSEAGSFKDRLGRKIAKWLSAAGFKMLPRSPYDHFMLSLHNFLKENEEFQRNCPKDHWDFPPRSCWVVFTDQVSHAALSGQYALEQTVLIPPQALLFPEKSPLKILECLSGKNMVDSLNIFSR